MTSRSAQAHARAVAERKASIMDAVEAFWDDVGYGPTRVDLAERTGLSESTVRTHVKALIEEGALTEEAGPRTLRVGF